MSVANLVVFNIPVFVFCVLIFILLAVRIAAKRHVRRASYVVT